MRLEKRANPFDTVLLMLAMVLFSNCLRPAVTIARQMRGREGVSCLVADDWTSFVLNEDFNCLFDDSSYRATDTCDGNGPLVSAIMYGQINSSKAMMAATKARTWNRKLPCRLGPRNRGVGLADTHDADADAAVILRLKLSYSVGL